MESKIFRDIRVCGEHFPDWEAVVDYVGETFVAKGYAKREYFEYIKKDMVENEAYMVIVPHFALLHSAPEHGALENVFHFMKLEHPVEFGHESNDPVAYVITFTSVDADSHIAGISLLAGMLMKEAFVEELSRADSDESLTACIRRYEE